MTFKTAYSESTFIYAMSDLEIKCGLRPSPYELCGPPVGLSWPASNSGTRTQFHSAVSIKNTIFRNVTSCCLVYEYAILIWKTTVTIFMKTWIKKQQITSKHFAYLSNFTALNLLRLFLLLSSDMQNEFRDRYSAVP